MAAILADPDGYSPSDIIKRLHTCIDSGTYGLDYIIDCRDKNEEFFQEYIISENDRIEILKKLSIEHYVRWEYSNNPRYPNDIVHIFLYSTHLRQRGVEDAPERLVRIYIKVTWAKPVGVLIVISFHD